MKRTICIETVDGWTGYTLITCAPGETVADAVARIPDACAYFDGDVWRDI